MSNFNKNFSSNYIDFKKISSNYLKGYYSYLSSNVADTAALFAISYFVKTKGSVKEALQFILCNIEDSATKEFVTKFARDVPEESVNDLSDRYSEEDLKNYLYSLESDFDRLATPIGISELASKLLCLEKDDTLIDLGSGAGAFLTYVDKHFSIRQKFGIELDTSNYIVSNLKKLVFNSGIEYIQGNILSQDFQKLKSNKIFSNPPLGNKLPNYSEINNTYSKFRIRYLKDLGNNATGDWAFTLAALSQQALSGKCVVIMSNSATWNKSDEQIRRKLVEEGKIEGVILLPENLYPKLPISLSMVIFSEKNKSVKMVDATKIFTEGRKVNSLGEMDVKMILDAYNNETGISRIVSIEEISLKDYILSPTRYISISREMKEFSLLGELVHTINRGAMIKANELSMLTTQDPTINKYLMLQNIREGIVSEDLPGLISIDEKYDKFCLEDGDLIISKISPFKVARVKVKKGMKILANGNLYFIKVDTKKINPTYLEFILQSEEGLAQLDRFAKGSIIKNISIKDLKEIKIPMIPLESQRMIAEQYLSICDDLMLLENQSQKLKDKREALINEVI